MQSPRLGAVRSPRVLAATPPECGVRGHASRITSCFPYPSDLIVAKRAGSVSTGLDVSGSTSLPRRAGKPPGDRERTIDRQTRVNQQRPFQVASYRDGLAGGRPSSDDGSVRLRGHALSAVSSGTKYRARISGHRSQQGRACAANTASVRQQSANRPI